MILINPLYVFFCFIFSAVSTLIILKIYKKNLKKFTCTPRGPQFIHDGEVCRFGGLSIFLTFLFISIINFINETDFRNFFLLFFIISIPTFFVGFLEDITQSIVPKFRLLGSMISGVLVVYIFNLSIAELGLERVDFLLEIQLISIFFTIFCIVYLIQAFNIIDGLNGLSLATAIISLLAVVVISYELKRYEVFTFSTYLIFIFLGIFIFNFPSGKIFLGDSGAYLLGLCLSIILITLFDKGQNLFSFVIVQIIIYTAYEIFRSIIRRLISKKDELFRADNKHLHSILYAYNLNHFSLNSKQANIITSSQIIFFQILNFFYVVNFYIDKKMTIIGIFVFVLIYEILYRFIMVKRNSNLEQ